MLFLSSSQELVHGGGGLLNQIPRTQQQKFTKPQPRKALFWSRMPKPQLWAVLGGSWVAISRVISGVIISRVITHIRGRITPLITTPEPPSMAHAF